MSSVKEQRFKKAELGFILVSVIFYLVLAIIYKVNIMLTLANILEIVAILLYADRVVLSIILFELVELCVWGAELMMPNTATSTWTTTRYIITYGVVLSLLWYIIGVKRRHKGEKVGVKVLIKNIIVGECKPIKIHLANRLIIYSLLITTAMSLASGVVTPKGSNLSMLSSLWVVMPTFASISMMLMISDVYIMMFIEQGIMLIIAYMQISLGKADIVAIISNLLITIALVISYLHYRVNTNYK